MKPSLLFPPSSSHPPILWPSRIACVVVGMPFVIVFLTQSWPMASPTVKRDGATCMSHTAWRWHTLRLFFHLHLCPSRVANLQQRPRQDQIQLGSENTLAYSSSTESCPSFFILCRTVIYKTLSFILIYWITLFLDYKTYFVNYKFWGPNSCNFHYLVWAIWSTSNLNIIQFKSQYQKTNYIPITVTSPWATHWIEPPTSLVNLATSLVPTFATPSGDLYPWPTPQPAPCWSLLLLQVPQLFSTVQPEWAF